MIPDSILEYLNREHVGFGRRWHPRVISGQQLAASLHISGHRVSKCVLVEIDGRKVIAVLPVSAQVDTQRLATSFGAETVRLLSEGALEAIFPDCELGAEPPLGRLYRMPVVIDDRYAQGDEIIFRAGSHEETVEMSMADYLALEHPQLIPLARPARARKAGRAEARA